eukprot:CAMPEP_0115091074 /NCGR_PEP_ID=MMETSP0227-20121206/25864_1 /TAXON_ID=89957 /ORGANISM="Polarella glacialis, Strain CCMP 1383" /LENGTH=371 /DNA_ID=CAMNT_0002482453 /DNA_START=73 /DNA_END=1188 /DNA_ORIENTATION=+
MRVAARVLLAPLVAATLAAASEVGPAATSQADVQAQQAKLADEMGKYYKSQYAPMAPAGGQVTTGSGAMGDQSAVNAQQSKMEADMGKFYAGQFAPPGVAAKVAKQQAAQAAAQAPQASADPAASSPNPEVALAAESPAPADAKPAVPRMAEDCKTMDELNVWYKARLDTLDKYVPKDYQHFAQASLKGEYDTNEKRIEEGPEPEPLDGSSGTSHKDHPTLSPLLLEAEDDDSLPALPDLAGDVDSAADSLKNKVETAREAFKKRMDGANDKAAAKADDAADRASAMADKVQRDADKIMKRLRQEQSQKANKATGDASPQLLAASAPTSYHVLHLALGLPVLASAVFAGLWLRNRRAKASQEVMSVYHFQA